MGSGITRLLSLNQGSDLLHGLKISYYNSRQLEKAIYTYLFWREMGKKKRDKNPVTEKGT